MLGKGGHFEHHNANCETNSADLDCLETFDKFYFCANKSFIHYYDVINFINYLRRRLASGEGIVTLGVCVCLCVRRAATARHISIGGEGNALYPVLSSYILC